MGRLTSIIGQSLLISVAILLAISTLVKAHSPLLDPPHINPPDCATPAFYSSLARPLVWSCLGLTVLLCGSRWLVKMRSAIDGSYEKNYWNPSTDTMPCRFEMPRIQRMSTRLDPTPPITPSTSTSSAVDSLIEPEKKEIVSEKKKKKKKKPTHHNNHHNQNPDKQIDTRNTSSSLQTIQQPQSTSLSISISSSLSSSSSSPSSILLSSTLKSKETKTPLQTPDAVPQPMAAINTTVIKPQPEHKPLKEPQAVTHQRKTPRNKSKYSKHTLNCEPLMPSIHTNPYSSPSSPSSPSTSTSTLDLTETLPMTTLPDTPLPLLKPRQLQKLQPRQPQPQPPLQPAIIPPTHQPIQRQNWYSPFSTGLEINIAARPGPSRDYKLFEDTLIGSDPLSYRTTPIGRPPHLTPGWRPWSSNTTNHTDPSPPHFSLFDRKLSFHTQH
ncbi:hypothetical protein J3Q64DRAFT_1825772 [Phycomyces blakesleeanus]|uniref:Transmembrane protein n=2 Tax=Phycomyces blakesleeanus TaxID=4837 RepID=A0A162WYN7_PHYB8|nr:hypothetical protein PHYBLDRAFT_70101 [Phycomyces blakesleeanus NRRL 1555(-)]OAD71565.1 hypothetical protein PHYBLDRAFT_70101 [Phycomyces blakesleeanus NRRL 1555(-)]|eukprot:XP_018289605.1 hypothetical protein PHYBLDRAFT_70101 [Phycomyces blakesleeanus NRRL 1555(-)]